MVGLLICVVSLSILMHMVCILKIIKKHHSFLPYPLHKNKWEKLVSLEFKIALIFTCVESNKIEGVPNESVTSQFPKCPFFLEVLVCFLSEPRKKVIFHARSESSVPSFAFNYRCKGGRKTKREKKTFKKK